ncbi:MAG: VRR-NUC domain-containing protein [Candidatus Nitrosopumilus sp. bin_68KS]
MKNKLNKSVRSTLIQNVMKGKIAEEIAKQDYKEHGFEIQKTGVGSDFIAIKENENFTYTEYVDVKSGNAKLTKKQKKTKNELRKENINYVVYRVTNKHLEYQIENNLKMQKMCQSYGFDISQFSGAFIIQDPTSCPSCKLNASGLREILINFGLRNMKDASVRVQSWCRNCRNYSRRGRK